MPLFALLDRWRAPAPAPRRVEWIGSCIYAHRGLHFAGVPENSRAAMAAALAQGFGIELDIQRSADGQAMVFHDWDLDRMTGETGALGRRTAEELGQIRLAGGSETIPTLRDMLALVAGKVPLLIEIKSRADARVAARCLAVRRELEGYRGPHAVISFDPRVASWFARHSPLTPRGLSYSEENDRTLAARIRRRLALWHARPDFITYDIRDLPSRFAAAQRRRGLALVTWTINSPALRIKAAGLADALVVEGGGVPEEAPTT